MKILNVNCLFLKNVYEILQTENPLREASLTKDELHILKTYQLLSVKPMLIALNFDESQINDTEKYPGGTCKE